MFGNQEAIENAKISLTNAKVAIEDAETANDDLGELIFRSLQSRFR
jgi:hypothetical protein